MSKSFSKFLQANTRISETSGSNGGEDKDDSLLEHSAVTFQCELPPRRHDYGGTSGKLVHFYETTRRNI
jgi:hypothetical protein